MISFSLPWAPSINHYYIHTGRGVILGKRGRDYRETVKSQLIEYRNSFNADARLAVTINLHPPDKRRRDIDNPLKCILDALQHACVFKDDNQIDLLTTARREIIKGGRIDVWVSECSLNG